MAESIAQGPKPRLTDRQQQRVKRWIWGRDPRQYGFDFGLWTRRIGPQLIQDKMGIPLCLTSGGKLLARLSITPQKPLRRASERDPQAVQWWLDPTYPKLKRRAKRLGAMIFFLDEAGFQSDPPLGRTCGLKGETPVGKTSGQRQSIHGIRAVNARGAFWAAPDEGKWNAASGVLRVVPAQFHEGADWESVSGSGWPSGPQSQKGQKRCGKFGRAVGVASFAHVGAGPQSR